MNRTKIPLIILSGLLLLSFLGAASAGIDWGYGWNNGPTYPPTPTPTPFISPTPTPTASTNPTSDVTANPTTTETQQPATQPTQDVIPIQSTNPTATPTPIVPEVTVLAVLAILLLTSAFAVIIRRNTNKKTN